MLVLIAIWVIIALTLGWFLGHVSALSKRKRDKRAEQALSEVRRWALRNSDVYSEASLVLTDIISTYYDTKEI